MTEAVLFDWRGTLVVNLTDVEWVGRALTALGRETDPAVVAEIASAIARANGAENRLDAPGVDCDAALHRRAFLDVLTDAGLDPELVESLYAVESDPRNNPFAGDVADTFAALRARGIRIAVVSDIHVDLRPAFDAAGLAGLVDVFTLSFEQGVQKPDPLMFTRTLDALGVGPDHTLMVGDRSRPDGAAVESGIPTLLLPPLRSVDHLRLHLVLALCGVG
ncbi:MAG: HAD family hydrolase [Blastococcus sp.]|nr:HAD family hydrolase [Blastococcus sp.]